MLGVPCVSSSGGINPSSFGGSSLGLSTIESHMEGGSLSPSPLQMPQSSDNQQSSRLAPSPQRLQGTIV